MNEWKEVWYVWDGVGEPPNQQEIIGVISGFHWLNNGAYPAEHFDLPLLYTTGQKRRRVECEFCRGFYVWAGSNGIEECAQCNKGKIWEYSE